MSKGATPTTARGIEAASAAEAAEQGELAFSGEYKLQYSSGQFRIGVDSFFPTNTNFGKGAVSGLYVDLERGMLVYDFQPGDEYQRPTGGDLDGEG